VVFKQLRSAAREAAIIRRLSAAAGVESPHGEALGLVLGIVVCCTLGGLLVAFYMSGGPPVRVYGAVIGQHLAETDFGTRLYARVQVDDRQPLVALPAGIVCQRGDRIELNRRKALLGYRYTVRPAGCDNSG
jgi:hypothetical protein